VVRRHSAASATDRPVNRGPKIALGTRKPSSRSAYITERYGFPCSRQWLAKLAVIGGGPVFRKAGRYPVYEPSELDRWAEARIGPPQRSTSEVDPA
jgi:hypothetical protein